MRTNAEYVQRTGLDEVQGLLPCTCEINGREYNSLDGTELYPTFLWSERQELIRRLTLWIVLMLSCSRSARNLLTV